MQRDPRLVPLSHDHQHALALCVIIDRTLARDPAAQSLTEQALAIVQKFDTEIRAHFDIEEQVLFPSLAELPELRALIDQLLSEHQRLIALIDHLRSASDRATVQAFTSLLQAHVRKEERDLFEKAQRLLPQAELDRLGELLIRR